MNKLIRPKIPCMGPAQRSALYASLLLSSICLYPQAAGAEQRLDMEGTAIFGNKESPNILYVVPWQKTEGLTPIPPPKMGSVADLLEPLDRDVFRRRIDWHQRYNGDSLKNPD
ncbi:MAG: hypothetical protein QNJ78_15145 [Gammaproteobacteria bacterium]|nr:hypothetical protein [Gammaproteobacteria bacterium]